MRRFLIAFATACLAGCASQSQSPAPQPVPQSPVGFAPAQLDRSVSACADFYGFANGGWMRSHPIPPGYASWGNFSVLSVSNQERMRAILEEAVRSKAAQGSDEQRVADYYAACMDERSIERSGLAPIAPLLRQVSTMPSISALPQVLANLHSLLIPAVFSFQSTQDSKNTEQVVASITQAGLGLPDRDYYTRTDPKSKEVRVRYVQFMAGMLQLLGDDQYNARSEARNIMDFETRLAEASMTNVELRDPVATYHKLTIDDLHNLAPSFSWREYFAALGLPALQSAVVGQPQFLGEFEEMVRTLPTDTWKSYLRWSLINAMATRLPRPFEEAHFDFYDRFLSGTTEMLPRWKRCTAATDTALGEALGRLWTQRYFPESAKVQALEMVHNITEALRENLGSLSWMSPQTRRQALAKLDAFGLKIGYPDKWRDYSAAAISSQPYVANALAASLFEFHRDAAKIGKAADRTEWFMSPPTVNAYNNSTMNEIVFPAGILQPPFFDPAADPAFNYGGMGAVIGHEIIHGFDDQGRQFDPRGNLTDWWTSEDKQRFLQRAKCVSDQFSSFDVRGEHMTGDLVLGESIADLGGLQIAYAAYQKYLEGKPRVSIDGFTPEQRFFLGWAQVWAENSTPQRERLQITTNPHPLARFRVNGPLSNMPEFAAAFACQPSEPMIRAEDKRCNVWGATTASK